MEKQLMLNITIKKEAEGGFSVVCTDLDVASQGETVDDAVENIKEAVELYIESAEEIGIMDEVWEKLGLSESVFAEEELIVPKVFRTEIQIKMPQKQ